MSRKALRLLFLHDSADDAEALLREVQRGAYSVTYDIVNTSQGMRNALEGATWDIIISDYSMSGFTALDALGVLKATGQDIPFIVISDTIGEEGAVQALTAGAADFLVKGRLTRLLSTMSRLLQDAASRAERHRVTEALSRSEEQHRALVDRAVFGICQASADGRLISVNPALVSILGYGSADELRRVPLPELFEDEAARLSLLQRVKDRRNFIGDEALWRKKNGKTVRVRLSGGAFEAGGKGSALSELIVEDTTERDTQLEHVRQEQKAEVIAEFAGGLAHEFNDVLTAILGFSGLLVEQLPADAPGGEDLREIVRAAERGAALTQRLRALARKQAVAASKSNGSPTTGSPVVTPGVPGLDSETILLIDDEESVRTFARTALSRGGYTIIEAPSAEAAVALLGTHGHPIDLVLSDIVLPGMNGRDLARHVAATTRDVRILLMTGHAGAHERGETKGRGGTQEFMLLEKPFTARSLVAKVREVLSEPVAAGR